MIQQREEGLAKFDQMKKIGGRKALNFRIKILPTSHLSTPLKDGG